MPERDRFLATTEWLAANLANPKVRVLECTVHLLRPAEGQRGFRVVPAIEDFEAGHIAGAGFADLHNDLSDPESKLRFMMPPAEQFAEAMSRYGVGDGSEVILYDRGGNMWATRIWWMLRAFGFDNARVLDGGWTKWTAEGLPVEQGKPGPVPAARFTARLRPELIAGKDEVLQAIESGQACIVNALNEATYRGETRTYARPGHIKGSKNVPAMGDSGVVDPATQTYRDLADIRAQFQAAGAKPGERMITYCGGGIAASSTAFAAVMAGYGDVALYDASLSEWAADESLPMVVEA